jgi:hypothetical protein
LRLPIPPSGHLTENITLFLTFSRFFGIK